LRPVCLLINLPWRLDYDMLDKLLNIIKAGGTLETRSLATRLDTTPQMVEAMLDHLQRSGRINAYVSCDDSCGGCKLKSDCSKPPLDGMKLWQLGK
jgi:hypothetical protein